MLSEARRIRTGARLSLREIASPLGVSSSTIHTWEKGGGQPTAAYLALLAELSGLMTDLNAAPPCPPRTPRQPADRKSYKTEYTGVYRRGQRFEAVVCVRGKGVENKYGFETAEAAAEWRTERRRALGEINPQPTDERAGGWSAEAIVRALKDWAELRGEPPTSKVVVGDRSLPSKSAYVRHFGSWSGALAAAGLAPRKGTALAGVHIGRNRQMVTGGILGAKRLGPGGRGNA